MQGSRKVKAAQPLDAWVEIGNGVTYDSLKRIVSHQRQENGNKRSVDEMKIRDELRQLIQKEIEQQEARFSEIVTISIDTAKKVLHKHIDEKMVEVFAECKLQCLRDVKNLETKVRDLEVHVNASVDTSIDTRKNTKVLVKDLKEEMNASLDGIRDQINGLNTKFATIYTQTYNDSIALKSLDLTVDEMHKTFDEMRNDVDKLELLRNQVLKTVEIVGETWDKMTGVDDNESHGNPHSDKDAANFSHNYDQHSDSSSTYNHSSNPSYYSTATNSTPRSPRSVWA